MMSPSILKLSILSKSNSNIQALLKSPQKVTSAPKHPKKNINNAFYSARVLPLITHKNPTDSHPRGGWASRIKGTHDVLKVVDGTKPHEGRVSTLNHMVVGEGARTRLRRNQKYRRKGGRHERVKSGAKFRKEGKNDNNKKKKHCRLG